MCFTKKKKQTQQMAELGNACEAHQSPLQFICLEALDYNLPVYGCIGCQSERKQDKFITFKDFNSNLQMQAAFNLVDEIKSKATPLFNETQKIRNDFIRLADEIHNSIIQGIEHIFTSTLLNEKVKIFSDRDVFLLFSEHTIEQFTGLTEQQLKLEKADQRCVQLLAKVLANENESKNLLNQIHFVPKQTGDKLLIRFKELQDIKTMINKSINQMIIQNDKQVHADSKESTLSFMVEAKAYTLNQHGQLKQQLGDLRQSKKIYQKQNLQGDQWDQMAVKSVVQLNDQYIAYANNKRQVFLLDSNKFEQVVTIDIEGDITVLGKKTIGDQTFLLVSVEITEDQYQIQMFDLVQMEKQKVFNAHSKYLWKILELPEELIATSSEDSLIKIFNVVSLKELRTLGLHQSSVNDLALINEEIIVSVSDDGCVMAAEFRTETMKGAQNQQAEIKCVTNLDGQKFLTGNSDGEVYIYLYGNEIQQLKKVLLHKNLIRFIIRVSPKIIVTGSYDGSSIFVDSDLEVIKKIEGSQQNFSEPIIWIQKSQCFIASQQGELVVFK